MHCTILVTIPGLNRDAQSLNSPYKIEVVSGASIDDLLRNLQALLDRVVVDAPKPEMTMEDWFDAIDLSNLSERVTIMPRRAKKL